MIGFNQFSMFHSRVLLIQEDRWLRLAQNESKAETRYEPNIA
jgi:hypothetical protein